MKACERAAEIQNILQKEYFISRVQCQEPLVSELPIGPSVSAFTLAINIYVKPSAISLSLLWSLTTPVMLNLFKSGKLNEFVRIGVQIIAMEYQKEGDRVLRVESLVTDFKDFPAKTPEDLLRDDIWDGSRFVCYWYWSKKGWETGTKTDPLQ